MVGIKNNLKILNGGVKNHVHSKCNSVISWGISRINVEVKLKAPGKIRSVFSINQIEIGVIKVVLDSIHVVSVLISLTLGLERVVGEN